MAMLVDGSIEFRWRVVKILGDGGSAAAVEYLISLLREDEDPAIREEAVRSLSKLNERAARLALLRVLQNDPVGEIRCAAAEGLGGYNDAEVVRALIDALQEEDCRVQRLAASALGKIGDSQAIPPLVSALVKEEPYVREQVVKSLCVFGQSSVMQLLAALEPAQRSDREIIVEALASVSSANSERLIEALDSPVPSVRQGTVLAIGRIRCVLAVPKLIAATREQDLGVVVAAVTSLGSFTDNEMVAQTLIDAAQHCDIQVRAASAEALGNMRSSRSIQMLLELLEDESELVFRLVEKSLGRIGGGSVGPLLLKLTDNRREIRERVVRALVQVGRPAVKPLTAALRNQDWRVRAGAAEALGDIN